ncbi:MAG: vitamin K epoxide reductase family protein [Actinomycetes bacterium]
MTLQTVVEAKVEPTIKLAWVMIITGLVGLFGAVSLTIERIHVWLNPDATLSCDVNVWISCKSVMLKPQASLFGFPNSFLGVLAFLAPIAMGVAALLGYRFGKSLWRVFYAGIGMGMVFVGFLFSQSNYVISILCPYCMVVWAAMIPLFVYTTIFMMREKISGGPKFLLKNIEAIAEWGWVIAIGLELLAIFAMLLRFSGLLPSLFRF